MRFKRICGELSGLRGAKGIKGALSEFDGILRGFKGL